MVSIGYSALSSSLMVTGEANFRVREDVRITGIKVLSFENEGYETYSAEYYKDGTKVMVTLPKTDSKVTYEVEIKNTSEESYQLKEIKDEIASNPQMKYEIQGLKLDDIIGPSETKTFQIVVSYQDGTSEVPSNNVVTFETRYAFEVFHIAPSQTRVNFAEYLKSIANPNTITTYADENGNQQEMYTFRQSATEQTEVLTDYRYIGNNPSNYVYFNCQNDNNVETCEKWRIIGVFPVEDENGTIKDRVKIIRDDSIGRKAWDSNDVNDWTKATLKSELNGSYYDELSETAQLMIGDAKYYLGGTTGSYSGHAGSTYYSYERGNKVYGSNSIYWIGKIALMYPSDFSYAYALGVDSTCYNSGYNCNTGNPSSGWLFNDKGQKTLVPISDRSDYAFVVGSTGYVSSYGGVSSVDEIRPVLYLSSIVVKTDGTGSFDDPYVIDPNIPPVISFDLSSGVYYKSSVVTVTIVGNNYNHMNVEVRNHNGRVENKSRNNIAKNTYAVTLEEEDTYTISVDAYDKNGNVIHAEQQYVISDSFASYLKSKANLVNVISYDAGKKEEMYAFNHITTEQTAMFTDYRYIGNIPNNYVYFNCEDDSNVETCEKWRIIGVFPVEDENGNIEERVKIIRDSSIGNMAWNSNYSDNSWENASLNTELNQTYYNELSDTSKEMIGDTKYYLGGNTVNQTSGPNWYSLERGNSVYSKNPKYWLGKIGLMYPSDYVYTYALGVSNTCYNSGNGCSSGNPSLGWMFHGVSSWTVTAESDDNVFVYGVYKSGYVGGGLSTTRDDYDAFPVLYLSSSAVRTDGNGSEEQPYVIDLAPKISFSLASGTYPETKVLTITANDSNYSHMEVEVTNSNGITKNSNITETTFEVKLNQYDTYTILVRAYDTSGNKKQKIVQYEIKEPSKTIYFKVKNSGKITSDAGLNFASTPTSTDLSKIYVVDGTQNDTYPIYYYRGTSEIKNNVIFAGYCWKIVRTTETGGVKILYSGKPTNGQCGQPNYYSNLAFRSQFNPKDNYSSYVGYMRGTDFSKTATDSIVKKYIDKWYDGTLRTDSDGYTEYYSGHGRINVTYPGIISYQNYLEDAVWCNDRSRYSTSSEEIDYGAYGRITRYGAPVTPIITCPEKKDAYTVNDTIHGNGALKYPVGMITIDEAVMAAGSNQNESKLLGSATFWTISPSYWSDSRGYYIGVASSNSIDASGSDTSWGVSPMVSLKFGVEVDSEGDGSLKKPFVIPDGQF